MNTPRMKNKALFIAFGLSAVIGLVILILPIVSEKPDGLEKVSEHTISFVKKDDFKHTTKAPMPDYKIPGLKQKFDTRQLAGIIGVFAVFGISVFIGYLLKRKRRNSRIN